MLLYVIHVIHGQAPVSSALEGLECSCDADERHCS